MNVGELFGRPQAVRQAPSAFWPLPDTHIGLEYELENPGNRRGALQGPALTMLDTLYEVHEDGSLRDRGIEYTFRQPLYGEQLREAIRLMGEHAVPFVCNYRTSLHVHVDVRDLDINGLKTLCYIYSLVERGFYLRAGPHREASNYCVPWYFADDYPFKVAQALFEPKSSRQVIRSTIGGLPRYAGLNLNAVHKYGSVEFRHLQTVVNADEVNAWVKVCMRIKKGAMDHPDPAYWQTLSHNREGLYRAVFGPDLAAARIPIPTEEEHAPCLLTAMLLLSAMTINKLGMDREYFGVNPAFFAAKNGG